MFFTLSLRESTLDVRFKSVPALKGLMLGQRRRRWTAIYPALNQRLVPVWKSKFENQYLEHFFSTQIMLNFNWVNFQV